jgi:phage shock protein PspC (stress-responsive transcriptional regulator)
MDLTMNDFDPTSGAPSPRRSKANDEPLTPKRLYRDPNGPLGGIAGGLAAYFDIDPVISRLLWIVALVSGIGVPAYLVCWLVIPKAKTWPPPGYQGGAVSPAPAQRQATLLSGLVIVGLAALIGKGIDGIGDLLLPAVLVGFGMYLLNQRSEEPRAEPYAAAGRGGAAEFDPLDDEADDFYADPGPRDSDSRDPEPRDNELKNGLVTPTVLSVLALVGGVLLALHSAGVVSVPLASAAAGGLVIVGAGLVASLWLGPARGLIPIGLGLGAVMLAAAAFTPWWRDAKAATADIRVQGDAAGPDTVGEHAYVPQTLDELQSEYVLAVGELTVDLSKLDFRGTSRDVKVNLGVGDATVIVPRGTSIEARAKVGVGELNVLDRKKNGLNNEVQHNETVEGAGKVSIDFNVGMGEGTVRYAN